MADTAFEIQVQDDHVERVAQTRKPILALAELIWNALDADANRVDIILEENALGAMDAIVVEDDGHGITHAEAADLFSKLGGSWKRSRRFSKEQKRMLHGQEGKGRLRSYSLGRVVDWSVCYEQPDGLHQFKISLVKDQPRKGVVTPDVKAPDGSHRGVTVRVSELHREFRSLESPETARDLAMIFALYMRQYPGVQIFYNNEPVDPSSVEAYAEAYPLPAVVDSSGKEYPCSIEIVEWTIKTQRRLYFCSEGGFPIDETSPGIQAPGFEFTAYLKSDYFSQLLAENAIDLANMDPAVQAALDAAKEAMRSHFRNRTEEQTRGLIEKWKQEQIYPYEDDPKSAVEDQERKVFNIAALNVATYLPRFDEADQKAKQLQLKLLRHAIETGPEDALRFLTEVLDLPQDRRQELASLLDKTTLSKIISATKLVTDRLEFLQGLRELVFDRDLKERTKERSQLHRLIAPNAWIFGEQYHLTVDDQNLTAALRAHLNLLDDETVVDDPVRRLDGSDGIIDLMFSRSLAVPGPSEREHLVVELKRPSVTIGTKEADQIESYAIAVADDDRFRDTATKWIFWVVSTEIHPAVIRRANQPGRARGILFQSDTPSITVWVKTWSQIIEDTAARMRFFERQLGYTPDRDSSLEHLSTTYAKHVGELLADKKAVKES